MTHGDAAKQPAWQEQDSAHFIDVGSIYTPRRQEIAEAFCDLLPAEDHESFTGVELGTGSGWLCEAILQRYPNATMIGLDGSEAMLQETQRRLEPFAGRYELKPFRLEAQEWIGALPANLRCAVSSLAIHHLDGPGKAALFRGLHATLAPGGALLICDLVEPANRWGQRHYSRAWNADVDWQSHDTFGNDTVFRQFIDDRWNMYEFPEDDDFDKPSTTVEQLRWLDEAGFQGTDVFWARAGHVLLGGYKQDRHQTPGRSQKEPDHDR